MVEEPRAQEPCIGGIRGRKTPYLANTQSVTAFRPCRQGFMAHMVLPLEVMHLLCHTTRGKLKPLQLREPLLGKGLLLSGRVRSSLDEASRSASCRAMHPHKALAEIGPLPTFMSGIDLSPSVNIPYAGTSPPWTLSAGR